MKNQRIRSGFTLIEMIVVLAVIVIVMSASAAALLDVFKANNRIRLANKVVQNGNWALNELNKNMLNTGGNNIVCGPNVSNQIKFESIFDGEETIITCYDDSKKIASESTKNGAFDLTSGDVRVSDCATFVTCDTLPSSEVSAVNFSFTIGAGVEGSPENSVEKNFQSKVVIRN